MSLRENVKIVRLGDLCVSARMNNAEYAVSVSLTDDGNILLSLGKNVEMNSPFTWVFSPDECDLLTDWFLEVMHTSRQRVVSIPSAQISASSSVESLVAQYRFEEPEPTKKKPRGRSHDR